MSNKLLLLPAFLLLLFANLDLAAQESRYQEKEAQLTPEWLRANLPASVVHRATTKITNGETTKDLLTPSTEAVKKSGSDQLSREKMREYKEGELFIKFKPAALNRIKPFLTALERSKSVTVSDVRMGLEKAKVRQLLQLSNENGLKSLNAIFRAKLEKGTTLETAINVLKQLPEVAYVEKVPLYHTLHAPNDPAYEEDIQYYLNLVHAVEAFDIHTGSSEVFVAIVDDAFLYDHPDLAANVVVSKCYDVADDDSDTRPPSSGDNKAGPFDFSHGTHVGGIAGAVTNNGLGMASISNNRIKLFGIKATSDDTNDPSTIERSFEGVARAIENGAKVINMSFGGSGNSTAWQEMIDEATANGVIFVAAAGNGNTSVKNYPAAYRNVIAVANTDEDDEKNFSSHFGDWVDISAPGSTIYSTVVADNGTSGAYGFNTGTSMSSPLVAGLVALLLSENATLSHNEVLSILQLTADDILAANPGFKDKLGAGRINAYNAMLAVKNLSVVPEAFFISSNPNIYSGQTVFFSSQSLGSGLTYSWSFPGGAPSSATAQSVAVVYENPGTYNVSLRVTNASGADVASIAQYVKVVEPQDCEILTFPFPGTRSFYSYIGDDDTNLGPVIGHNDNEFTQFANLYSYLPGNYISGGLFAVGLVESDDPENAVVSFKVWDEVDANGLPGAVLARQDVSFDELVVARGNQSKTNRSSYTEVVFDNPPLVPADGNFFMGFEIHYDNDTVGFYTNEDGEGDGDDTFFFGEGAWFSFSELEFDANIEMSPVLIDESYLDVAPFIAEAGACINSSVNFNTEAIQNAVAYNWTFEGGSPATSTSPNPQVTYASAGEYQARLLVTLEGCEDARREITQTIRIVDCNMEPIAEFSADKLQIAAGDSVHFFENSENATGFAWTFEGGFPITSGLPDPYVIYPAPGIFKVRLEVQNPIGEVAAVVKEAYIKVLEADACDFDLNVSLNDPFPGTPTLFPTDGGYIFGTNDTDDMAKAEYFGGFGSTALLSRLELAFAVANASDANATVEVAIFDDEGFNGAPGNILATQPIKISDIADDISDNSATVVIFDEGVLLEGAFYAGILLDNNDSGTTVALFSSDDDEVETNTSWEQKANGQWVETSTRWSLGSDPLEVGLYISAFFEETSKVPYVELIGSADAIGVGDPFNIDASGSMGYTSFIWRSSPEVALDETGLTQDFVFNTPGVYSFTLTALNECSREGERTIDVVVRNPLGLKEDLAAGKIKVAVYPNPFDRKTNIDYYVEARDHIKLEIFNAVGQRITILVNELKEKGNHQIQFDGSGLSPGLYIYRLVIGEKHAASGRIILN